MLKHQSESGGDIVYKDLYHYIYNYAFFIIYVITLSFHPPRDDITRAKFVFLCDFGLTAIEGRKKRVQGTVVVLG